MSVIDKVVWREGMFLRPQHLQQQDRYYNAQFRGRCESLTSYSSGLDHLKLDEALLQQGVFAIVSAKGLFKDTFFFEITQDDRLLREVTPQNQGMTICLALPHSILGAKDTSKSDDIQSVTRWRSEPIEVADSNVESSKSVSIEVSRPRFQLLLAEELSADYSAVPLARIKDVNSDGRIELDDQYIMPCLSLHASSRLKVLTQEVLSLLSHRAEVIAERLKGGADQRAGAELADFLLLQLVNRFGAKLGHQVNLERIHPERVFETLVSLSGELATFTRKDKRPSNLPAYDHWKLEQCFGDLMTELREQLSLVFEQSARSIPLRESRFGIRVGSIQDRSLLEKARFYLAISGDWSSEMLRTRIPTLIKAGGVEQLTELVNLQLPGITLVPALVPPRQIPYTAGQTLFHLEKSFEHWEQLKKSAGIAFHCSGEISNLKMELWAVVDPEQNL